MPALPVPERGDERTSGRPRRFCRVDGSGDRRHAERRRPGRGREDRRDRPEARRRPTPRTSTRPRSIVMPGFIDTHRHTWQTPVRGVLPCCTLDAYFDGMLEQHRHQLPPRGRLHREPMPARSRRSTPASRRCSTGRTSTTRPSTPTRPCTGLQDAGIRGVYAHGIPGDNAGGHTATRGHPEDITAHPQAVLLLRRPAADARDGRARGRERHARNRDSTTGRWRASSASGSASTSACA